MRRQKRDKEDRAFSKGYQAGLNGRSRDICPYAELSPKQSWINGWRQGRHDQWDGYTGVSGISNTS